VCRAAAVCARREFAGVYGEAACDSLSPSCVASVYFWNYGILFVVNSHTIYCLVLFFLEVQMRLFDVVAMS
jgi:hypothetical protein